MLRGQELTAVDLLGAYPAVEGCPNTGTLEVELGFLELRLGRLEAGSGLGHLGLTHHQCARLAFTQLLPFLDRDLRFGLLLYHLELCLGDLGARSSNRHLVITGVELD